MATVTIDFSDVGEKLRALLGRLKARPWLAVIAKEMRMVADRSFEKQQSPEGVPWAPLKEPYATWKQAKKPNKGILQFSGRLWNRSAGGLRSGVEGNRAFVQTLPLPYASAHQFGSRHMIPALRPKRAKALRFFAADGEAFFARGTRAHPVNIPARPFLGFPESSQEKVVKDIEDELTENFNG